MNWKRWLGMTPEVKMEGEPLGINVSPDERRERNRQRIARLYQAIVNGDSRPEVREELDRLMKLERR